MRVHGPELTWEIRDSNAGLVETRLDGLFAKLLDARLRAANARVRGEWNAVLRAAEDRAREAAQRALQLEQARQQLLTSHLARWRTARDVRDFVSDMRARAPIDDPPVAEFLDWCTRFVVQLDPATPVNVNETPEFCI